MKKVAGKHIDFLNASFLWNFIFGLTMLVYAMGLFIPIMEPDAAVYAQVSMEMHDRGDYLSIYHKGADWLDKPHFPFWMSALSYEIFGVTTFAYKLPAVLFILLGAFYTYQFGKKFYSPLHGWIAVIILITAEHIIISNQDVRAEPFMTGLMIMGLFHFSSLINNPGSYKSLFPAALGRRTAAMAVAGRKADPVHSKIWMHLLIGSLAAACLIMTKGLFTIIPLVSGIGFALIYQKNWRAIFHWQWPAAAVMILLFLSPAIYGYYQQFDRHPEKIVFGENNVSGVRFFLWTSQWGRFTNTGPIKGKGDISFFIHTLLWAFLPWAFAAFFALFRKIRQLIKGITIGENYTFFGFITLFLIFSLSSFQLSFYLNPLFPFLSILTAAVLLNASGKVLRIFSGIHFVLGGLLVTGLVLLHYFFSADTPHMDTLLVLMAGFVLAFYIFLKRGIYLKKIIFGTSLVVLSVNYYLNRDFYPALLKYQAESEAAYFMKENKIRGGEVVFVGEMESVADVILHQPTKVIPLNSMTTDEIAGKYVFITPEGLAKMDSLEVSYNIIRTFKDFPVTRLTGKFIHRKTRAGEVSIKYVVKTVEMKGKTANVFPLTPPAVLPAIHSTGFLR